MPDTGDGALSPTNSLECVGAALRANGSISLHLPRSNTSACVHHPEWQQCKTHWTLRVYDETLVSRHESTLIPGVTR